MTCVSVAHEVTKTTSGARLASNTSETSVFFLPKAHSPDRAYIYSEEGACCKAGTFSFYGMSIGLEAQLNLWVLLAWNPHILNCELQLGILRHAYVA